VASVQDRLQVVGPRQGRRPRQGQDQDQDEDQNQVIPWSEFVQDVVNYGHRMGMDQMLPVI